MALFGQDRPQIGAGWGVLGDMLGGGGRGIEDQAYQRQLGANHDNNYRMERAGRERALRIIDEGRQQALDGMEQTLGGIDPGLSPWGGVLRAGGGNAPQLTQAILGAQQYGNRAGAVDAALGGDPTTANAYLTGVASGPLKRTDVRGGVAFDPYAAPEQAMHQTPLGEADVALRGAQAEQAAAGASRNEEQARLAGVRADAGGFAPRVPRSGGEAKRDPIADHVTRTNIDRVNREADARLKRSRELAAMGGKDSLTGEVAESPSGIEAWRRSEIERITGKGANTADGRTPGLPDPQDMGGLFGGSYGAPQGYPAIGEVRRGYRYIGGDPAAQTSWVKQ
jgi:hypothetical protein